MASLLAFSVSVTGYAQPRASSTAIETVLGKTVAAVEVQGLKRLEQEAVLGKIATKPGQVLSSREQVRSDIKAIFGMGFFDDIEAAAEQLDSQRVKLIFTVRERPVVSKVEFEGNERIESGDLRDVIKVKEWSILDVNRVKEDVALLQKHYEDKGYYLAKVSFVIRPAKNDQVELIYKVNDYDKVQIKKITFLNNKHFSDERLKSIFQETREGGFLSFLNSSGNFKESAFKIDLQRLTYWYLDNGYVKFRYENPVVTVSDDKKWLFISIYVDEGEQYQMGNTEFSGDLLFPKEELQTDLLLETGKTFSISRRNLDIQRLTEKYQDLGYAFVNVIPKMNVRDETRTVEIDYGFEKGNLVTFGEINVLGNSKTHDKVIRRELKIREGELYSGTRLRLSREGVERLGYFAPGEVVFNTVSPKGKPDVLNVEISVKERSTGTITLGAGYGSVQGFFFTSTVSEINLMGRGQTVSLQVQYSASATENNSFNLGFTDPYAFDTRWSMGFDIYTISFDIPLKYHTRKLGFDVRFGHPIGDYTNAFITYKNEGLNISDLSDPDLALNKKDLVDPDIGVLSSIVWSVVRDKRNNRFETTDGNYQSASLETAGLGGDKHFVKWSLNNRYYKRLIGDLVFRNSLEVGQISAISSDKLPPSEKFYLGGPNNMRGYSLFSLGPTLTTTDGSRIPLGGTFQTLGLFELEYPLLRDAGLKFVSFFDAGNTWESVPRNGRPFTLRTDVGFGFRWFSPIGPLRFEFGFPLARKSDVESESQFVFFIGPPF
ncbi:MAG: outer membrane protein assembly factor BamA [Oligoflexia bacterium]|nr:outer membrane protein assembly factor BamA [Oligoflexia bacterium]